MGTPGRHGSNFEFYRGVEAASASSRTPMILELVSQCYPMRMGSWNDVVHLRLEVLGCS